MYVCVWKVAQCIHRKQVGRRDNKAMEQHEETEQFRHMRPGNDEARHHQGDKLHRSSDVSKARHMLRKYQKGSLSLSIVMTMGETRNGSSPKPGAEARPCAIYQVMGW